MRAAKIFFKGQEAGILTQQDDGTFTFQYNSSWIDDKSKPPISLTLPKIVAPYHSPYLFPFFYNMLPEGSNKQIVCQLNRLDKTDYFGLLLTIATTDTIGAVTVSKID
ncbi:MAG: HipA N-terminal domain-containing protein [Bacteroidetes bacterium]|nr:HipA N-terminal domain-containing protein [Bacteroidota bacterium]